MPLVSNTSPKHGTTPPKSALSPWISNRNIPDPSFGVSLSLVQRCRIMWKYTPGYQVQGQEFLQYLVRSISGRKHLDKF